MSHIDIGKIIAILGKEVRPAMGCTEPAAVALACAYAARVCEGEIQSVEVFVDPNVYKNGMGVYVPGADMTGLSVAAALGAVIAQPELELQVLGAVTPDIKRAALRLVESIICRSCRPARWLATRARAYSAVQTPDIGSPRCRTPWAFLP